MAARSKFATRVPTIEQRDLVDEAIRRALGDGLSNPAELGGDIAAGIDAGVNAGPERSSFLASGNEGGQIGMQGLFNALKVTGVGGVLGDAVTRNVAGGVADQAIQQSVEGAAQKAAEQTLLEKAGEKAADVGLRAVTGGTASVAADFAGELVPGAAGKFLESYLNKDLTGTVGAVAEGAQGTPFQAPLEVVRDFASTAEGKFGETRKTEVDPLNPFDDFLLAASNIMGIARGRKPTFKAEVVAGIEGAQTINEINKLNLAAGRLKLVGETLERGRAAIARSWTLPPDQQGEVLDQFLDNVKQELGEETAGIVANRLLEYPGAFNADLGNALANDPILAGASVMGDDELLAVLNQPETWMRLEARGIRDLSPKIAATMNRVITYLDENETEVWEKALADGFTPDDVTGVMHVIPIADRGEVASYIDMLSRHPDLAEGFGMELPKDAARMAIADQKAAMNERLERLRQEGRLNLEDDKHRNRLALMYEQLGGDLTLIDAKTTASEYLALLNAQIDERLIEKRGETQIVVDDAASENTIEQIGARGAVQQVVDDNKAENAVSLEEAKQENRVELAGVKQEDALERIGATGNERRKTVAAQGLETRITQLQKDNAAGERLVLQLDGARQRNEARIVAQSERQLANHIHDRQVILDNLESDLKLLDAKEQVGIRAMIAEQRHELDVLGQKHGYTLDEIHARGDTTMEVNAARIAQQAAVDARQAQIVASLKVKHERFKAELDAAAGPSLPETNAIRGQYLQLSKPFVVRRTAFNTFESAVETWRGAGGESADREANAPAQLAIVFGFMKSLDPTSVVRESEQRLAIESEGILPRMRQRLEALLNGERLTADQVENMEQTVRRQFEAAQRAQDTVNQEFTRAAVTAGFDPNQVVVLGSGDPIEATEDDVAMVKRTLGLADAPPTPENMQKVIDMLGAMGLSLPGAGVR